MGIEEPFEVWAERFLRRRAQRVGELAAVPMTLGPVRAAHVAPHEPRVIVRWDGYRWEPVNMASDYAAAQRFIMQLEDPSQDSHARKNKALLPKPTGRHRKPSDGSS
ncbi:DUF6087 family protein [Streptomyces sp. NPDC056549]|uniref:DUF6087 family protein n=1 Tax=Streptomyces sp. NPDC056549 TaxID=3345864 RepID=UPI00368D90A1